MAKGGDGSPPQPSSASGKRPALRSRPYDPNDSFVKKVATKVTDLIPQRSWISKWFNNSQDESAPPTVEEENPECDGFEDQQSQPPPPKRPCIRMDVTHPPGTFSIKPRNRNLVNQLQPPREQFLNHNDTTAQDFLEPTPSGSKLPRFVASTPAFSMGVNKIPNSQSALNMLISETSNNGTANGMDDNSESGESTSGCSSLIPQNNRQEAPVNTNFATSFGSKRRCIDDKMSFASQLRSTRLFLDGTARETLSSRRPSFDPTVAGTRLDKSLSSPFYSGNTMFGGANAANLYRSSSVLSETSQIQLRAPNRASVEVKPSRESTTDVSGMSQTARRILEALEQFSSPLADAKKMPVRNMSWMTSPTSSLARKRTREDETSSTRVGFRHLTRELVVPTIPDILRIRRKQKLQNTTINARKIMNARSASDLASGEMERRDYQLRHDSPSEPKRNQMKATRKTNLMEEDTVEAVNLPAMPLPVSSLPRFDFSLPQRSKPQNLEKPPVLNQLDNNESFKFASPIRLSDGAKNFESINNFTFSKPMSPSKITFNQSLREDSAHELSKTVSLDSDDTILCTPSFSNFSSSGPSQLQSQLPSKRVESSMAPKVASDLKTGSVMDFFASMAKQTTKLNESNVWECNECLIKNNESESHCVACKSSRHNDSSSSVELLDDDCEEISQDTKTSKIEIKKSEKSSIPPLPSLFGNSNFNSHLKPLSAIGNNLNFNSNSNSSSSVIVLDSSDDDSSPEIVAVKPVTKSDPPAPPKPVKNSWECPCCMVRNLEAVTSCPCCNTAKPGSVNVSPKRTSSQIGVVAPLPTTSTNTTTTTSTGFGAQFAKPEGSWTCDTCMITNKPDLAKCAACETPKPGAKPVSSSLGSSATGSSGFGNLFKKAEGSWTCDSCMITNKSEASKCAACETAKPGSTAEAAKPTLQFKSSVPSVAASGFKFGVDKAEESAKTASAPSASGFAFGNSSVAAASAGFSFGVLSSDKSKDSASAGFAFKPSESVTAAATFQFGAKPIETKDKEEAPKAPPAATFSFGASPKADTKIPSAGFVFGQSAVTSTAKVETEKKSEPQPVVGGFSFGAPKPVEAQADKGSTEKKSDTASTTPATSGFTFNAPTTSISFAPKDESKKTETFKASDAPVSNAPNATFGDTPKTTPSFSFKATVTTAPASSTSSNTPSAMFTFGGQSAATKTFEFNKSSSNLFGKPEAAPASQSIASASPATPMFGSGSAAASFSNQTSQATPSLFGNPSTASTSAAGATENKPSMFGSAAPENKGAPSFGEPKTKLRAFGSTTDSNKTSTFPTPNFGAAAANATPSAAPPAFGSSVFGGAASSTFGANAPSGGIFGAPKSAETTPANSGLFSFGQSSQNASAPTTGGFNFSSGSNSTATSSDQKQQQGLFSFGASSSSATQVAASGFGSSSSSFGGSAAPTAAASPSFTFNAPVKPAESSGGFGQSTSTPMFNAPSTMFNAPASNPAPPPAYPGTASPAPASTGFNFGSTNMPASFNFGSGSAPATGSFTFNAPAPSASPAPAFDPNAQPTFNFTGGTAPTTFNATPTVGNRKMKKAVRRMLPRQ